MSFKIENRLVGSDESPLVIAELGINHGGSLDVALELAESAIRAGAEVIKHQTHIPEMEMSVEAETVIPGNAEVSIAEVIRNSTLSENDEFELMNFVKENGAIFMSTPFSREAADRLQKFDVPAFKIGSGECNNYPLVEYIAKFSKPIILSTGMNSIESIRISVEILRDYKIDFALLHCTNMYPTAAENIRLGAMRELHENFPDAVIGLSDHSLTNYPCIAAVAQGASIVERHYTDTKSRIGPDISCSMDESELKSLLEAIEIVNKAKGGKKRPIEGESATIAFAFSSVVATKDIEPGSFLSEENIWVMRPSGGDFGPGDLKALYGRRAVRPIKKRTQVSILDLQID
jgi:N-acetylneuraminate synthase